MPRFAPDFQTGRADSVLSDVFVSLFVSLFPTVTMRMRVTLTLLLILLLCSAVICSIEAFQALQGVTVKPVKTSSDGAESTTDDEVIDIGEWLSSSSSNSNINGGGKSLLVFGTYAADFNAIEYGQRLRYYWPKLKNDRGFERCAFLLNCQPDAAKKLCNYVDLPSDIEVWVDNTGEAGRKFGVSKGWLPENKDVNPFLKLFGMLWGMYVCMMLCVSC